MISPCYKCTERFIPCHDTCAKYGQYKVVTEVENAARRQYSDNKSIAVESAIRSNRTSKARGI